MSFLLSHTFPILPVCFYAFAALLLGSALMVVCSKHPVQSALYLVLTFFASSVLWIIAEAEFLGLILILVYVGAVMTLFLFVVMTVPFTMPLRKQHHYTYLLAGLIVIALFFVLMLKVCTSFHYLPMPAQDHIRPIIANTQTIGAQLYTQYLFPFELAGLILLLAIIAAISLGTKYNRGKIIVHSKEQIIVTEQSRLKIIKMASEQKPGVTTHD